MRVAILGASKNTGYEVLRALLDADDANDAVVLLRNPACFDNDAAVSAAIRSGRVRVVQGDATRVEDVRKLFDTRVEAVVTSVGGTPRLTLSGAKLTDPTVCTRATSALLAALAELPSSPRVMAVSSMGIGEEHSTMPFALRILYPWMLAGPHADKEGLEYLYQRAASGLPTPDWLPPAEILSPKAAAAAPENVLPQVTIVRPALLTAGAARGAKAKERLSTYTCSRRDVGAFIADELRRREWVNKCPVVGY